MIFSNEGEKKLISLLKFAGRKFGDDSLVDNTLYTSKT